MSPTLLKASHVVCMKVRKEIWCSQMRNCGGIEKIDVYPRATERSLEHYNCRPNESLARQWLDTNLASNGAEY